MNTRNPIAPVCGECKYYVKAHCKMWQVKIPIVDINDYRYCDCGEVTDAILANMRSQYRAEHTI